MAVLRAATFAQSTKQTYVTHLRKYLVFCQKTLIKPVPISQQDLACYIAYLAEHLCFNSVKQYINCVRILHQEAGVPSPVSSFQVSAVLKGVRRIYGDSVTQKLPITVEILRKIFRNIDFSDSFDKCFWAVCLVAFFSFLRKSNLLITSCSMFRKDRDLCRGDLSFYVDYALIKIRHSKTIQYRERGLSIPIPRLRNSNLCPVSACCLSFLDAPCLPDQAAFQYRVNERIRPIIYSNFLSRLKRALSEEGINPSGYAGHSFRRGGATLAFTSGLPSELIKLHGDWRSQAYLLYLDPPMAKRIQVAKRMGKEIEN